MEESEDDDNDDEYNNPPSATSDSAVDEEGEVDRRETEQCLSIDNSTRANYHVHRPPRRSLFGIEL